MTQPSLEHKTRALQAIAIAAIASLGVGAFTALAQQAGLKLHPLAQVGVAVASGILGSVITGRYVQGQWVEDDEFPYGDSIPQQHEHHHHLSPAMQQALRMVDSPPPPPSPLSGVYPALGNGHNPVFHPPSPPISSPLPLPTPAENGAFTPPSYPPSYPVKEVSFTPPPPSPLRLDGMASEVPVDFGQNGEFVVVGNGLDNFGNWDE